MSKRTHNYGIEMINSGICLQSILYYLMDGGVIRYNNVTIKTKFHAEGGLGKTDGRFEANKHAAEYLVKKYPELVSIFHRKNGMTEVKLKRMMKDANKNETVEETEGETKKGRKSLKKTRKKSRKTIKRK